MIALLLFLDACYIAAAAVAILCLLCSFHLLLHPLHPTDPKRPNHCFHEIAYSTLKRHVHFLYHIPKTTASRHQKLDFPWEPLGYPDCLFSLQHSFMLLVRGLV